MLLTYKLLLVVNAIYIYSIYRQYLNFVCDYLDGYIYVCTMEYDSQDSFSAF